MSEVPRTAQERRRQLSSLRPLNAAFRLLTWNIDKKVGLYTGAVITERDRSGNASDREMSRRLMSTIASDPNGVTTADLETLVAEGQSGVLINWLPDAWHEGLIQPDELGPNRPYRGVRWRATAMGLHRLAQVEPPPRDRLARWITVRGSTLDFSGIGHTGDIVECELRDCTVILPGDRKVEVTAGRIIVPRLRAPRLEIVQGREVGKGRARTSYKIPVSVTVRGGIATPGSCLSSPEAGL